MEKAVIEAFLNKHLEVIAANQGFKQLMTQLGQERVEKCAIEDLLAPYISPMLLKNLVQGVQKVLEQKRSVKDLKLFLTPCADPAQLRWFKVHLEQGVYQDTEGCWVFLKDITYETKLQCLQSYLEEGIVTDSQKTLEEIQHFIKEQEQTLAQLKQYQEYYYALFERSIEPVYIHDLQGRFIGMNAAARQLAGIPDRHDVTRYHIMDFLDEDGMALAQKVINEVLEKGYTSRPYRFQLYTLYGSILTMEIRASLVYREHSPAAIIGVAKDITPLERARKALLRTQAQLQATLEGSSEAFILLDEQGRFLMANPQGYQWIKQFRIPIPIQHGKAIEPSDNPHFRPLIQAIEKALKGKVSYLYLKIHHHQNTYYFKAHCYPIYEKENQKLIGVCVNMVNITESEQQRIQLEEQKKRYNLLIQNLKDVIMLLDPEGKILFSNDAVKYLLQRHPGALLYRYFTTLLATEEAEKLFIEVWNKIKNREQEEELIELPLRHKDGKKVIAEIYLRLFDDRKNTLVILHDITERKQREEEQHYYMTLLRAVFEHSGDALITYYKENLEVYMYNHHTLQLLDLAPTTAIRSVEDIIQFREEHKKQWMLERLRKEKVWEGEFSFTTAKNKVVWVNAAISPLKVDNLWLLRLKDITQRKQNEERLRLAFTAIHNAPDGIAIARWSNDGKLKIYEANRDFQAWIPQYHDAIDLYTLLLSILPEDAIEGFKQAIQQQNPYTFKVQLQKNGETLWSSWHLFPLQMDETIYWVAIVRDITAEVAYHKLLKKKEEERLETIIKAQEAERKRFAEELHDGLGLLLSVLKMNFSTLAENYLLKNKPVPQQKINEIADLIDQVIRNVRETSRNLMPSTLYDFGLISALETLCHQTEKAANIKIDFEVVGNYTTFDRDFELYIYRIVQECLSNIVKHAEASHVYIHMSIEEDSLWLSIEDDGRGFNVEEQLRSQGMGLKNLYTRAELLNAHLEIDSAPGKGTLITLHIPFVKPKMRSL